MSKLSKLSKKVLGERTHYKTFNGKKFKLYVVTHKKKSNKFHLKWLKLQKFNTRTIPKKRNGKMAYYIYRSVKRKTKPKRKKK